MQRTNWGWLIRFFIWAFSPFADRFNNISRTYGSLNFLSIFSGEVQSSSSPIEKHPKDGFSVILITFQTL